MRQLSRDHSLGELEGATGAHGSNVITRAVGVQPGLTLDTYYDVARADDRFLLCSDGLTRVVSEPQISEWLEHKDIREAVNGLIATTLDAGAPDNVTVLVVEAHA